MKRLLFVPLIMFTIVAIAQPLVKVDVSSDTVAIGETVEVTYTIENGDGKFNMPDMTDLPVISGPNSSSSFMYQQGKMSSNQSYSFTLLAMEEGVLKVPEASYHTDAENITINPVEIVVLAGPKPKSSSKSKAETSTSKTSREKRKF